MELFVRCIFVSFGTHDIGLLFCASFEVI